MPTAIPKSVRELVEALFGVNTLTEPFSKVTGGAGAIVQAAQLNAGRLALTLINLSANALYALPGVNPSATNGIRLDPNGGRVILNIFYDMELPTYEWNIFDAVGGSNYLVLETKMVPSGG